MSISTPAVYAKIGEENLTEFAENNILYYDPCTNEGGTSGMMLSGEDPGTRFRKDAYANHWDGKSCTPVTEQRAKFLKKQVSYVQSVAAKYGLPWEALLGQSFQESGGGENEACDYNPLGLKAGDGQASCGEYAKFGSYEEAWDAYATKYYATREARNKFPQDPYSYAEFIENGTSESWMAYCSWKDGCQDYTANTSSLICGIQKWAEKNGITTSAVTYDNWNDGKFVDNVSDYNSGGSTIVSTSTNTDSLTLDSMDVDTSTMSKVTGFDRITFYGPEASANGGHAWTNASSDINGGKLAEGQVAVRSGSGLSIGDVIYVKARNGAQKSKKAVNGKYFIVADAGPPAGTLDVFRTDGETTDYGVITNFTIYKAASNVSWEDYKATYQKENNAPSLLSQYNYKVDNCGTPDQQQIGNMKDGSQIADMAIKMAWPFQVEDGADKANKCYQNYTKDLVEFDGKYTNSDCRLNPKPAYKEGFIKVWDEAGSNTCSGGDVCDCTRFVTTVVISTGVDPHFPKATSGGVTDYLNNNENAKKVWTKVGEFDKGLKESDLRPGDLIVKDGHTFIYLGNRAGKWGNAAQASLGKTVGVLSKRTTWTGFQAFRLKSTSNTSSCQFNSKDGEGCTFYCQGGGEDWAQKVYGPCPSSGSTCETLSTYGCSACGPTSLAMVITNLTGKKVLPTDVGDKAVKIGARVCGGGSKIDEIVKIVGDYGLKKKKIEWTKESINNALDEGAVVYLKSHGSAPFSKNGHFVAIRGKTTDGKWLLFNSSDSCQKGSWSGSKKAYDPDAFLSAASSERGGPYAIYR